MADAPERSPTLDEERWLLDEASRGVPSEPRACALRADDQQLRAQLFARLPAARLESQVRARQAVVPARSYGLLAVGLAAACALLLMWPRSAPRQLETTERSKGLAPSLQVYRRQGSSAELLGPETPLRAHDVLQLGYVAAGHAHGVLLSIDGAGQVTLHQPAEPQASTRLQGTQGERLLTTAYELDDAPDFERFFWIVADQPLPVDTLLARARALATDKDRAQRELLVLPARATQYTVSFRKETP